MDVIKAKLLDLFEYNSYFNVELINTIVPKLDLFPERVELVMNHILNSHIFWNNRLTGKPDIDRWQKHAPADLLKINEANHALTRKIIEERDLSEMITFKNSKGGDSHSSIEDIYFHLTNHGTYHRAQLAVMFRESGVAEPLRTDYIYWKIWIKNK